MYQKNILIISGIAILSSACTQNISNQSPAQPAHQDNTSSDTANVASTETETASQLLKPVTIEAPVLIDELSLLIHPISPVQIDNKKETSGITSKVMSSYQRGKKGYSPPQNFYQHSTFNYRTNLNNIVFESIASDQSTSDQSVTTLLDDQPITAHQPALATKNMLFKHNNFLITNMFYPHHTMTRSLVCYEHDKAQQHCENIDNYNQQEHNDSRVVIKKELIQQELFGKFIYKIQEQQLTKEQLDDIKGNIHLQMSLYISDEHGNDVKKLHTDDQYVTDSTWIPSLQRYYFTTRANTNDNNIIDLNDEQYNYVIDFTNETPITVAYTPF